MDIGCHSEYRGNVSALSFRRHFVHTAGCPFIAVLCISLWLWSAFIVFFGYWCIVQFDVIDERCNRSKSHLALPDAMRKRSSNESNSCSSFTCFTCPKWSRFLKTRWTYNRNSLKSEYEFEFGFSIPDFDTQSLLNQYLDSEFGLKIWNLILETSI